MANLDDMDDMGIEINSAEMESSVKEENEGLMVTYEELARIQIWDRNCNPCLWDRKHAMIIPDKYINVVFRKIREFRKFLVYFSTSRIPSKKRHPATLATIDDTE